MKRLDVTAAVVIRGGRLFLATRRNGSQYGGLWEFPGGKVEAGESLEECIIRELKEELAWKVLSARECGVLSQERSGQSTLVLHFMRCVVAEDSQPVPQDGQQAQWFSSQEWDSLEMAPMDRLFLESHRSELQEWLSDKAAQQ